MSEQIYIFNPEHDLCIANGDENFVPPRSAVGFAKDNLELSGHLKRPNKQRRNIIPWGWKHSLKKRLINEGIDFIGYSLFESRNGAYIRNILASNEDSGHQQYSIAVADSGSTRLAMGRSKCKTTISLIGVISGKKVTESVEIRIRNNKECKRTKAPLSARMKAFGEKMQAKWYVFRAQCKYWWLSQKKWQKALWIALLAIWLGLLFSSIGRKPEVKVASDQVQTAYIFS